MEGPTPEAFRTVRDMGVHEDEIYVVNWEKRRRDLWRQQAGKWEKLIPDFEDTTHGFWYWTGEGMVVNAKPTPGTCHGRASRSGWIGGQASLQPT